MNWKLSSAQYLLICVRFYFIQLWRTLLTCIILPLEDWFKEERLQVTLTWHIYKFTSQYFHSCSHVWKEKKGIPYTHNQYESRSLLKRNTTSSALHWEMRVSLVIYSNWSLFRTVFLFSIHLEFSDFKHKLFKVRKVLLYGVIQTLVESDYCFQTLTLSVVA